MLGLLQEAEYLLCAQIVNSGNAFVDIAFHCVGLSWASLSIGKAGDFGSFEGIFDEGTHWLLIDLFIRWHMIVCVIEVKGGFFEVFGEIDFLFVLADDDLTLIADSHDIGLVLL